MKTWVFDLDQTLYTNYDVYDEFNARVVNRISKDLGESSDIISLHLHDYWQNGKTVYDYIKDRKLNIAEVVSDMFEIDRRKYLSKDQALRDVLMKIDPCKYILTDGIRKHAEDSISILGVEDLFLGLHCYDDSNYATKREESMYQSFFEKFRLSPSECIFVEDSAPNLEIGKKLGMTTVNVKNFKASYIDFSIGSVYELSSIVDLI